MDKTQISITLDTDVLGRVDALAERRREPRSQLISRMLRNRLDEEEKFADGIESRFVGPIYDLVTRPAVFTFLSMLDGDDVESPEFKEKVQRLQEVMAEGRERRGKRSKKSKRQSDVQ